MPQFRQRARGRLDSEGSEHWAASKDDVFLSDDAKALRNFSAVYDAKLVSYARVS